ncbi:hypothetical protein [Falsibacillus albus]|uniref:hypothetical protein n=1 Tax=Falsibacillus albus TaxID=2478915 RepID=UPI001314F4E9|nr:hypothetical protein [Falsibacillus albus]
MDGEAPPSVDQVNSHNQPENKIDNKELPTISKEEMKQEKIENDLVVHQSQSNPFSFLSLFKKKKT